MLPIPNAALNQHIVVLGKTRSGKSSTLRILVEHLLDNKKPVCIIDPKGDWWGIKSSASGKRAGYDVVIFGGVHADVPINQHSGKIIAELVAIGNRPCIIDLGGWFVGERTRFFIDFASTLFAKTHGHRWLVIDESHNFAPQGKIMDVDAGKMLHWANRLASEGAGKGIVLLSASQRPQKVHKDYLTSHETLIAKRVIHPLDRAAMKDWIDGCGDPVKGKEVLDTMAGLQRSEGWVWSPEINFGPKRVRFPMFKTYDSFAVQTGRAGRKLKGWATVDLEDVKSKLAAVVEEAKANDPKELRAAVIKKDQEIAQLKSELGSRTKANPETVKAAEARGFEQAKRKLTASIEQKVKAAQLKILTDLINRVRGATVSTTDVKFEPSIPIVHSQPAAPRIKQTQMTEQPNGKMPPIVRKILDQIHRANPVALSFESAALRAAVSRRSSAYDRYRQIVESSEEIQRREDGRLFSAPGYATPVERGANPIDAFAARLPPSYARMLRAIATQGGPVTKEQIAQIANISPTSSGLASGLRELLALALIEQENDSYTLHQDLSV